MVLGLLAGACDRVGGDKTWLTESAAALGVKHTWISGADGHYYFPEAAGGGAALLDFDNDGDLDLYLVQGGSLGKELDPALSDQLYRNDLVPGGRLHFTNVTAESGIRAPGYGIGAAAGDYDGDGWVDIYVSNFGHNQMWHNRGDGTFEDVTGAAGVDDDRWSSSASFADYDGDGRLDLFSATYVEYVAEHAKTCSGPGNRNDYCGPSAFPNTIDRLFHNEGNGRFRDVTHLAGMDAKKGAGLGVVAADFDGDGRLDFYVANDQMENFLWLQTRPGRFQEGALMAGTAVNRDGVAEASMGVDAGDVDGDGDLDLFMTHLDGQTNTLYVNNGHGVFEDATARLGVGSPSVPSTGFGTVFVDLDNDGWLDLVAANGRVSAAGAEPGIPADQIYAQPNQIFINNGGNAFRDASELGGPEFTRPLTSRGLAVGDLDNDGDSDLVIVNWDGPAQVFLNNVGNANHWLGLDLRRASRAVALSAVAVVTTPSGRHLTRSPHTDGSFASSNDPRILFGLGREPGPVAVEVRWPGGEMETWKAVPVDGYIQLIEGGGTRRVPGS